MDAGADVKRLVAKGRMSRKAASPAVAPHRMAFKQRQRKGDVAAHVSVTTKAQVVNSRWQQAGKVCALICCMREKLN
ncbi:MAG TPA: hypothetical protein DCP91_00745 [Eggerthellaceae bacterium]|nr:hypothetical protein [Eggerthellaceae bacterium]